MQLPGEPFGLSRIQYVKISKPAGQVRFLGIRSFRRLVRQLVNGGAQPAPLLPRQALDRDDFGLVQSKIMNSDLSLTFRAG
jgi:hypothetical protein